MSIQYDENGLVIQTLLEILNERENVCKATFGDDFYMTGESAVANLQSADADRELDIQELLLYLASQLDPNQAEGIWLDYICALNNIQRYKATKSTIPITVNGTPGTAKNIGEVMIVDEASDEYYVNNQAFVIGQDGTAKVQFIATSWGEITALSTSSFSLKTPSSGITSVAYDTSGSAVVGRETESDEDLRARRNEAVTYTASSILSSIKATVQQLPGIKYINAYENDTMQTVDTLPAKSFEVVVEGGDDDEIAKAILQKKPAGIQSYGSLTKTVEDADGNQFNIGFTRPTKIPVDFKITFVSSVEQTSEWKQNLKNELVSAFDDLYNVGESVYTYNLYYILNNHPEITNVTSFQVKKHSGAESTYNDSVAIGKRELATLVEDNITITQSV